MTSIAIDNQAEIQAAPRHKRPWLRPALAIGMVASGAASCEPKGSTVYYEPTFAVSTALPEGVTALTRPEWAKGNCQPDYADDFAATIEGEPVDTLAGWSLGRLGIAYFFDTASPELRAQVNHVIYYDPANKEDYTTNTCDIRTPSQSSQLAAWLAEDPNNHATILAGTETMDSGHLTADGKTSAGVHLTLLPNIKSTPLAAQVKLCEQNIGHIQVLQNNASIMAGFYSPDCPPGMTKQPI